MTKSFPVMPRWLRRMTIAAGALYIVGMIPVDRLFDLEGRGSLQGWVSYGTLQAIGLILLFLSIILYSTHFKRWASGPLFALSGTVILVALSLTIAYFEPPRSGCWIDRSVYQCGNEYLITQDVEYTDGSDDTEYRLIGTHYPFSAIRPIKVLYDKFGEADDDFYEQFDKDSVKYAGKLWHRVSNY